MSKYFLDTGAGSITLPGMDKFTAIFTDLIEGRLTDEDAASFLISLADQGESSDQLVAAATILRTKAIKIGPWPDAIDLCGTGGDGAGTVNISTASALITAACGAKVAKHGNRAASSRSGASDVLGALGIAVATNPVQAKVQYELCGISFLNAPDFHPALAAVAPLRRRLGRRTIFNLLGPLLNPAGVKRQLVGVYTPSLMPVFAEAFRRLGSSHVFVAHGAGLDELTVTGESDVVKLDSGQITQHRIDPAALGLDLWNPEDLRGGDPSENAALLVAMLQGIPGAYHDIAVLNAGAALVVAGKAETIGHGVVLAKDAVKSGAALDLLNKMRHQKL